MNRKILVSLSFVLLILLAGATNPSFSKEKPNSPHYIDNQTTPINSSDIIAVENGKLKFNVKKLIDPDYWETFNFS